MRSAAPIRLSSFLVNVADLLGLASVDQALLRFETALRRSVMVDDPFLSGIAGHLISAGGKRLRPSLALAAAATAGPGGLGEAVVQGGVAVELVHLASLHHDDVMDEADRRRTVSSVNARWGNLVAVVTGDFLLARAAGIAASLGSDAASLLAYTLGRMCEGQVAEVHAMFDPERPEAAYMTAIAGKTASLTSCACRIGALTAGLGTGEQEALGEFGEAFGLVFQIRDDILDVVATEDDLGKEAGQDLAKGIYTLPVLIALEDPDVGPELRSLLGVPLDQAARLAARSLVTESGAIADAVKEARRWADVAANAVSALGRGEAVKALAGLPHALMDTVPVPAA